MRRALLGAVGFALIGSAGGCGIFGPDQSVILPVSEVVAPPSVAPGAALSVVLTVVTGGCVRFTNIETRRSSSAAEITVWGRDGAKGRNDIACPQDVRYETHSVRFDPPFTSVFTVTVVQPRTPPHTITVRVE